MPSVAFMVDATLEPIDVKRLCQAFGWPEFGGRIGGVISKLRMREGVVTLGTTLRAQVFDGNVTISDLRLEQPLRPVAALFLRHRARQSRPGADDGRVLVRTHHRPAVRPRSTGCGCSTGRRSRSMRGSTRRRATARSIASVSARSRTSAASAAAAPASTAALSSGFLRFFDDFNYERLGLSCRLENDVCAMDGVAPAPNGGYYLVKGKACRASTSSAARGASIGRVWCSS